MKRVSLLERPVVFTVTAFFLVSCCENGSRYPHRELENVDIVGSWVLMSGTLDGKLCFNRNGGFTLHLEENERVKKLILEGSYRLVSNTVEQVFLLESEAVYENPSRVEKEYMRFYLGQDRVLRAEQQAKVQPINFIKDFY